MSQAGKSDRYLVSIVVPMYNEELAINEFFDRIENQTSNEKYDWEIICVNDGSSDNTLRILLAISEKDPKIKIIDLSRNFGKEAALTAGLEYARGDAVIPIDADLQDPPELIEQLLQKWREGYDVVHAVRVSRKTDSFIKRLTAKLFYYSYNSISTVRIPANAGDFRLMDRRVVEALSKLPERNRFMKGLFSWVGFSSYHIEYERHKRSSGSTSFNYWKLWNFALDGMASFSTVPLRLWMYIGLFVSIISMFYASYLIIRTLIFGTDVPGYASLMVAVLFFGGIQLISLGIIGEYLGRVYQEVKRRPIYVVNHLYGFESEGAVGQTNRVSNASFPDPW